uniref:Ribosomal protein L6 n=1 Tax=Ophirina amphinema TaxID=2108040 RepID=A0A348AYR8_9EUKA|nr:ribosomal protein L6 [Ophirina amphinema]
MSSNFICNFNQVDGVSYFYNPKEILVKGRLGATSVPMCPQVKVGVSRREGDKSSISVAGDKKQVLTFITHLKNASNGVSYGYLKVLSLVGVGYRASTEPNLLRLKLGYSHDVVFRVPKDIRIAVANNTLIYVFGVDKQVVGTTSDMVRSFRKPEAYKGKGVRYETEIINLKEVKKR